MKLRMEIGYRDLFLISGGACAATSAYLYASHNYLYAMLCGLDAAALILISWIKIK